MLRQGKSLCKALFISPFLLQAGFDVAAQLTTWGNWVPPGILPLQPGIAEVLFQAWKFPLASGKVPFKLLLTSRMRCQLYNLISSWGLKRLHTQIL